MDGVAGLDGLTVKTRCLSGYSHYPPPQPPAQLSPSTSSTPLRQPSDALCPILGPRKRSQTWHNRQVGNKARKSVSLSHLF